MQADTRLDRYAWLAGGVTDFDFNIVPSMHIRSIEAGAPNQDARPACTRLLGVVRASDSVNGVADLKGKQGGDLRP